MGEFVIVTGDEVTIKPPEDTGAMYTLVPPTPLPIVGSSPHARVRGVPACVPDDIEKKLKAAFTYVAGTFTVAGGGDISFELEDANKSRKTVDTTTSGSEEPLVVSGVAFKAKFTFTKSAQDPNGVVDADRQPASSKDGTASFGTPTKNAILRVQ
ncbi:hypothetical protein OG788_40020 [Streptomyces sp. NBC_00647]|uniref:hypothetical protein n=1 Tax=Streptomyces sp. NBC_00647 TaxID=2975796 RepID=UPI0032525B53